MKEAILKIGALPPHPNDIKSLMIQYEESGIPETTDFRKIKYIGSSAYSEKTQTVMLYDNELNDFDYLICVKVCYMTKVLLSSEVLILKNSTVITSALEPIPTATSAVKYRLPLHYFKSITPSVEDFSADPHNIPESLRVSRYITTEPMPSKEPIIVNTTQIDATSVITRSGIEKVSRLWSKHKAIMFCEIMEFLYRDSIGTTGNPPETDLASINKIAELKKELECKD